MTDQWIGRNDVEPESAGPGVGPGARPPVIAHVYLTASVTALAASFAPLWVPAPDDDPHTDIGTLSLWTLLPDDAGAPALFGLVLIAALVGISLTTAVVPSAGRLAPAALLVLCVLAVAVLLSKPNTGTPAPSFGPGAGLLFGSAVAVGLTAVTDLLLGIFWTRRDGP